MQVAGKDFGKIKNSSSMVLKTRNYHMLGSDPGLQQIVWTLCQWGVNRSQKYHRMASNFLSLLKDHQQKQYDAGFGWLRNLVSLSFLGGEILAEATCSSFRAFGFRSGQVRYQLTHTCETSQVWGLDEIETIPANIIRIHCKKIKPDKQDFVYI